MDRIRYLHRDKMATGDCLLWSSSTIIGKLIQWFCGAKENHASLVIRFREYGADRVFLLEALEHGIVLRHLSERLENYKGRVWLHPLLPNVSGATRREIGAWGLTRAGTGYDYYSLFKQILFRVNADARQFFCSEYVYFAWKDGGELPLDEEHAPRPCDIPKLGLTGKPLLIYGDENGG